MKRFWTEYPETFGVTQKSMEVRNLSDLKAKLNPPMTLWNVHIDPIAHRDPIWGEYFCVKGRVDEYQECESQVVIGFCNFFEL